MGELNVSDIVLCVIKILVMVFFVMVFIGLTIEMATPELIEIRTTECYDKRDNEIKGLTCIEEVRCGVIGRAFVKGCSKNE